MMKKIRDFIIFSIIVAVIIDGSLGLSSYSENMANLTPFIITLGLIITSITLMFTVFMHIIISGVEQTNITDDEYKSIQSVNDIDIPHKKVFLFKQIVLILLMFLVASSGFIYSSFALLTWIIVRGFLMGIIRSLKEQSLHLEHKFSEDKLHLIENNNN